MSDCRLGSSNSRYKGLISKTIVHKPFKEAAIYSTKWCKTRRRWSICRAKVWLILSRRSTYSHNLMTSNVPRIPTLIPCLTSSRSFNRALGVSSRLYNMQNSHISSLARAEDMKAHRASTIQRTTTSRPWVSTPKRKVVPALSLYHLTEMQMCAVTPSPNLKVQNKCNFKTMGDNKIKIETRISPLEMIGVIRRLSIFPWLTSCNSRWLPLDTISMKRLKENKCLAPS